MEYHTFPGSKEGFRSNLNIFELPVSDIGITNCSELKITSSTTIRDNYNPICFNIPASGTQYYDLQNSYMYLKARILTKDLSQIPSSDIVAPMSLFYYGLFNNLKVIVNNRLISDDMGLFHYKNIIPLLLTKGKEEEESIMSSVLCYRDSEYNSFDTTKNPGFKKRVSIAASSATFDMTGPVPHELFAQARYIPPGVSLQLTFTRNAPELCLESSVTSKSSVSGVPWTFTLDEAYVVIKAHNVHPEIFRQHETLFSRNIRAQIPYKSSSVRVSQIGIGASSFTSEILWNSKIPMYVILGLTEASAFTGALNKNPLNFEPHSISSVTLKCEQDALLYRTIDVEFDMNTYQMGYRSIVDCLTDKIGGNNINRDSYKKGFTYYAFSLVPTPTASELIGERTGAVRVELQFKKPTTVALNCVALGFFQTLLEVDGDRNIYLS